jgi:hypothetical protein
MDGGNGTVTVPPAMVEHQKLFSQSGSMSYREQKLAEAKPHEQLFRSASLTSVSGFPKDGNGEYDDPVTGCQWQCCCDAFSHYYFSA